MALPTALASESALDPPRTSPAGRRGHALEAIRRRLAADLAPRGVTEAVLVERISVAVARLGPGDGEPVEAGGYGQLASLVGDRRYLCARDMVMRYAGRDADELWLGLRALRMLQRARDHGVRERQNEPGSPFPVLSARGYAE